MKVPFTRWPDHLAARYRENGYWIGRPLTDILTQRARQAPDAQALLCGARSFSYQALDEASELLAISLHERGLRRHDTALVQLPNVAEFYIAFFALLKIGVVPVNALYTHRAYELREYAAQLQPSLLIGAAEHPLFGDRIFAESLKTIAPGLDEVLRLGSGEEDDLARCIAPGTGQVRRLPEAAGPTAADDVAFFQLSGGSTGTPKLIPRTHDDYFYSIRASADICALGPRTRYLCALPAGHNYPLSSPGALGVFYAGGTVALERDPGAAGCFAAIERHSLTMAALVPSAVLLWLQHAPGRRYQLRTLDLLQVGGASLPEAIARRIPEELGCKLQQVFGMAEGLVNYTRLDDNEEHVFTTQGRPICADDEIRVVDESGNPVLPGEPGMLATRGPYTIRGYYRAEEYDRIAFDADGFYRSGDVVAALPGGYLRVVGRVKDQINRGGEKIASEEIERLLIRHEAIDDVAVIAIPDEKLGEKSFAFFVSRENDVKPATLRRYLRELGIAPYKLPDRFEPIDRLPLTPVGKVDKKALRGRTVQPIPQT